MNRAQNSTPMLQLKAQRTIVKDSEPDRTTTPSAEPPKSEEQSDTSSESSKNDENAQDSSESSSTTSSKSSKSDVSYHEDGEEGIQLEVISS